MIPTSGIKRVYLWKFQKEPKHWGRIGRRASVGCTAPCQKTCICFADLGVFWGGAGTQVCTVGHLVLYCCGQSQGASRSSPQRAPTLPLAYTTPPGEHQPRLAPTHTTSLVTLL